MDRNTGIIKKQTGRKSKRYRIAVGVVGLIFCLISFLKSGQELTGIQILGMTLGIMLIIPYAEKYEVEKEIKKRTIFFRRKYPLFAGNLSLLLRSGMSPKNAFLYLAKEYRAEKDPLKQELVQLQMKLTSGYTEVLAYKEFGEACMATEYKRLMSLVIQYLEQGTKYLNILLEMEMKEAASTRLRLAKQAGEEISTKMLLPMGLLLLDVIAIVIAPVMGSMASMQGI